MSQGRRCEKALLVVAVWLAFGGLSPAAARCTADLGQARYFGDTRETHPRVREDGTVMQVKLELSGCKGKRVPVQVFGPGDVFLGEEIAVPPYKNTVYKEFPIFIPDHRIAKLPTSGSLSVFVLPPSDSRSFIEKAVYNVEKNLASGIWTALSYGENIRLENGKRGFQLKVKLEIHDRKDERLTLVLLLRNGNLRDFERHEGGPIRLEDSWLRPKWEASVWNELTLEVPYDALDGVGLGRTVMLTPSLRDASGKLEPGNVHVRFYSGGSLTGLRDEFARRVSKLDDEIHRLENELGALRRGGRPSGGLR